jgi:hypothetical protein
LRNNMVNLQNPQNVFLQTTTVPTLVLCLCPNLQSNGFRDLTHWVKGSINPRLTASSRAVAFRKRSS